METNTQPKGKFSHPKVGGLWNKVSQSSGKSFLSGDITINDSTGQAITVELLIFPNGFKQEGENTPDLTIYQTKIGKAKAFKKKDNAAPKAKEPNSAAQTVTDDLPL